MLGGQRTHASRAGLPYSVVRPCRTGLDDGNRARQRTISGYVDSSYKRAFTMETQARLYHFGSGRTDGNRTMKALLGGKGANLAELSQQGLPVPPGFTITTATCAAYFEAGRVWPEELSRDLDEAVGHLERVTDRRLGATGRPLLISVRSGAAVSMPGMMDTILNLGLNDRVAEALARETGDERFAYDAYRRFLDMFGAVVMGIDHGGFEQALQTLKAERGVQYDTELTATDLRDLVERYKAVYRLHTGHMPPTNPREQLRFAIEAVFNSWMSDRAVKYRRFNQIRGLVGTAVNVQAMVFGNRGQGSGTGVLFSRHPSTGAPGMFGEYLQNAQGEDVVAGIRTPLPLTALRDEMPDIYAQLEAAVTRIEQHYGDMQDIEFTVEEETLYLLQARNGKRTGAAAVRIATDLVREGVVSRARAVRDLVEPRHIDQLLHPRFANEGSLGERVIARGLPASPGAAVGQAVFSAEAAEQAHAEGRPVILVRIETSPEDVGGMHAAEGILTSRGGMTSHAAVVARGWGKPCVAGSAEIVVNEALGQFTTGTVTVRAGDWLSLNGATGEVVLGRETLVPPELTGDFAQFMTWTDAFRRLRVRANADRPSDAVQALTFGAEGIGLCRTEHMFFEGDRIQAMRAMILATTDRERAKALEQLLPLQRADFRALFEAMDGLPVTVRLLDPPLHEFLPHDSDGQADMAEHLGVSVDVVREQVERQREQNPMLGHRGCRLGITHPQITEMQARAVAEAAVDAAEAGCEARPEIMVPLVGTVAELDHQKAILERVFDEVFEERGRRVPIPIGTMIEVPRAALVAGDIAESASFFSFGTNDLTQMTFGYSRDDAGMVVLPFYLKHGVLPDDPFQTLDQDGVGALIRLAASRGRATNPDLHLGLCGEHGGDPDSVAFVHDVGLDYVSCSPFRVPVARLAAAQAALRRLNEEPESATLHPELEKTP